MADKQTEAESRPEKAEGFSLIELIVAMAILTVFTAVFLAAVVGLARGTTQAKVTAESSSGALLVFQNLDRQVRYADAINYPGTSESTGYRYIEFRTPASSTPRGETTCNQWRYMPSLNRIESRHWVDGAGSAMSAWGTKLTTVIDVPGTTYPFELIPADGEAMQQLKLTLEAGAAATGTQSSISTTYVARNSSKSVTNAVGANGQSVTPVCQRDALRP